MPARKGCWRFASSGNCRVSRTMASDILQYIPLWPAGFLHAFWPGSARLAALCPGQSLPQFPRDMIEHRPLHRCCPRSGKQAHRADGCPRSPMPRVSLPQCFPMSAERSWFHSSRTRNTPPPLSSTNVVCLTSLLPAKRCCYSTNARICRRAFMAYFILWRFYRSSCITISPSFSSPFL